MCSEVDFEYPKELRELVNDFSLALVEIEIKNEMLSKYQLKTENFCSISFVTVKRVGN